MKWVIALTRGTPSLWWSDTAGDWGRRDSATEFDSVADALSVIKANMLDYAKVERADESSGESIEPPASAPAGGICTPLCDEHGRPIHVIKS